MKKITQADYETMPIVGRGRRSPLFKELLALAPGEGIEIGAQEWNRKYSPMQMATAIARRYKRRYEGGRNAKTGAWVIVRKV